MNPQGQQNPFLTAMMAMRNKAQAGQPATAPQGPTQQSQGQMGAMSVGGGQGAGGAAAKANLPSNQAGSNPGSTGALLKALSSINEVITSTDDPQEIKLARQVILLLQQMLQADQQKQGSRESALSQSMAQAQNYPPQAITMPSFPRPDQGGQPSGQPGPLRGA